MFANLLTSIVQVTLPVYVKNDPSTHYDNVKSMRGKVFKLLKSFMPISDGEHLDPLYFRGPTMQDNDKPNPYYAIAPNWTNLPYGKDARVVLPPYDFAEILMDVATCSDEFGGVEITILDEQGERVVDLAGLMALPAAHTVKEIPSYGSLMAQQRTQEQNEEVEAALARIAARRNARSIGGMSASSAAASAAPAAAAGPSSPSSSSVRSDTVEELNTEIAMSRSRRKRPLDN